MRDHTSRRRGIWLVGILATAAWGCVEPRSGVEGKDPRVPDGSLGRGQANGDALALDAPVAPDDDGGFAPISGDAGVPVDPGCQPGFHTCSGQCVDSKAVASCGVACEPCPTVKDGQATCDGIKCGIVCPAQTKPCIDACIPANAPCGDTCPAGRSPCNGICVDSSSLSSCGSACAPCPTSPSGVASCDGDKCALKCNAGFHKCGDACVSNKDPATCGGSCDPCPPPTGGKASCDGNQCGVDCPAGTVPCIGACIPVGQACQGKCLDGKHACNNNCVSNTDNGSCGTSSCNACPVPDHADATCNGTSCGFKCRSGFHDCSGECKDNKSVASCGSMSCDACPSTANGSPTCDGTSCGIKCDEGFHRCGTSSCRSNTDPGSCGTRCDPCPAAPQGGAAACRGGQCDFDCKTGHKCDNACRECCSPGDCDPQPDKVAACGGGKCSYTCRNGTIPSGNGCAACGGVGQPCCAGNSCPGGICSNGLCCPDGQKNCSGQCQDCCNAGDCRPMTNKTASCNGGTCSYTVNKKQNGESCGANSECLSNRCPDGICCGSTCKQCETCTGANGTCVLPSGVKACGSACIPRTECCNCDTTRTCSPSGNVAFNFCNPSNGNCEPKTETCSFLCRNGACTGDCKPGDEQCTDSIQDKKTCDANGHFVTTTCATGDFPGCCGKGQCVDLNNDVSNCGTCGNVCFFGSFGQKCSLGHCIN